MNSMIQTPAKISGIKSSLFKMAAVLLSVVLLGIGLEGILRAAGLKAPEFVTWKQFKDNYPKLYYSHSELLWSGMFGQIIEYKNIVRNNAFSFHDVDHPFEKPPDTYRILFLGDSFVEALQVPLQDTFFKILERRINQNRSKTKQLKKVEVIAIARSAMGAIREHEHLRDLGIKYSPDLVLCFFTSQNDFKDDLAYFAQTQKKNGADVSAQDTGLPDQAPNQSTQGDLILYEKLCFIKGSYLNRWIAFKIIEMLRQPRVRKNLTRIYQNDLLPFHKEEGSRGVWKVAYQITAKNYIQMNELCKKINARFLAVFVDNAFTYQTKLSDKVYHLVPEFKGKLDFYQPMMRLENLFNFYQIKFFNLNPGFSAAYQRDRKIRHFVYDGHWNKDGHKLAADLLEEYLLNNRLLDEASPL